MKNKENTKRRLIKAVGEIIQASGFKSVKVSTVARKAEVDRNLIYRYFKNLDGLVEAYVVENDYWMTFAEHFRSVLKEKKSDDSKDLIISILQDQFRFFLQEKDMQNLILMELSEENELLKSIHRARESIGEYLLELSDLHFTNGKVNFRAVAALIVGGIYYVVLHSRFNGSKFADLDLSTDKDQLSLIRAIAQIISWAYDADE